MDLSANVLPGVTPYSAPEGTWYSNVDLCSRTASTFIVLGVILKRRNVKGNYTWLLLVLTNISIIEYCFLDTQLYYRNWNLAKVDVLKMRNFFFLSQRP